MSWPAWVNGHQVPTAEAALSLHDRGVRGEGVFTTVLAVDGVAVDLAAHVERVRDGLTQLRLAAPPSGVLVDAVRELLAAVPAERAALRLVVTPGASDPSGVFPPGPHPRAVPTIAVTAHPVAAGGGPVTAVSSRRRRPLPTVKSLSYGVEQLAVREAREAGADTAILVDDRGYLLEGATAALTTVVGGTLVSPPADGRILPSTALPRLLRAAGRLDLPVVRRDVHGAELAVADGTLLVSAVSGPRVVEAVDGVTLEHGWAERLRRAYAEVLHADVATG